MSFTYIYNKFISFILLITFPSVVQALQNNTNVTILQSINQININVTNLKPFDDDENVVQNIVKESHIVTNNQMHTNVANLQPLDDDKNDKPVFVITGGYRPKRHNMAKYAVSIRRKNFFDFSFTKYFGAKHFCGGTILSPTLILTAAHCLVRDGVRTKTYEMEVVASTPKRLEKTKDSQVRGVRETILHPNFKMQGIKADIGLVILDKPLLLDGKLAAKIPLPRTRPVPNTECTVVGWGRLYQFGPYPNEILHVNLVILDEEHCSIILRPTEKNKICACNETDHEKDSCHGDSGGPLFCNDTITGIVSYGFGCASGLPGVYTDVYGYKDWIKASDCSLPENYFRLIYLLVFVILQCVS